jgi:hypothetical protein
MYSDKDSTSEVYIIPIHRTEYTCARMPLGQSFDYKDIPREILPNVLFEVSLEDPARV